MVTKKIIFVWLIASLALFFFNGRPLVPRRAVGANLNRLVSRPEAIFTLLQRKYRPPALLRRAGGANVNRYLTGAGKNTIEKPEAPRRYRPLIALVGGRAEFKGREKI